MFYAHGTSISHTWHLYITDLDFDANGGTTAVCEFYLVDRCHLQNSVWRNGAGVGLQLGYDGGAVPDNGDPNACMPDTYQASTSLILDCEFQENADWGLKILNGIDFTIQGGSTWWLNHGGIYWKGPPYCASLGCYSDPNLKNKLTRGIGTIKDVEIASSAGRNSIWLERAYMIRVTGCTLDKPVAMFDTQYCFVE